MMFCLVPSRQLQHALPSATTLTPAPTIITLKSCPGAGGGWLYIAGAIAVIAIPRDCSAFGGRVMVIVVVAGGSEGGGGGAYTPCERVASAEVRARAPSSAVVGGAS